MTIQHATQKILDYLLSENKHSIKYSELNRFIDTGNNQEEDLASILLALEEFEKAQLISKYQPADIKSAIWILKANFGAHPQTVTLDGNLCISIASIVNDFTERAGININSNPLNIKQSDIEMLLELIGVLSGMPDDDIPPNVAEEINRELDKEDKKRGKKK